MHICFRGAENFTVFFFLSSAPFLLYAKEIWESDVCTACLYTSTFERMFVLKTYQL